MTLNREGSERMEERERKKRKICVVSDTGKDKEIEKEVHPLRGRKIMREGQ